MKTLFFSLAWLATLTAARAQLTTPPVDLAPGQTVTYTYDVTINAGTAAGTDISAQATVTGTNIPAPVLSDDQVETIGHDWQHALWNPVTDEIRALAA